LDEHAEACDHDAKERESALGVQQYCRSERDRWQLTRGALQHAHDDRPGVERGDASTKNPMLHAGTSGCRERRGPRRAFASSRRPRWHSGAATAAIRVRVREL
jgi:hypothetical protein